MRRLRTGPARKAATLTDLSAQPVAPPRAEAFDAGGGDIGRTGEIIRAAFDDVAFQYFLREHLAPEQLLDKQMVDSAVELLNALKGDTCGRIKQTGTNAP